MNAPIRAMATEHRVEWQTKVEALTYNGDQ